jgi:hypothetical protein
MSDGGLLGMEQAVNAAMAENGAIRDREQDVADRLARVSLRASSLMMQLMPVVNGLHALREDVRGVVRDTVDAETEGRSVPLDYLAALAGANPDVLHTVSNGLANAQLRRSCAVA